MAETLVENQICGACEANVRAGALFCYNCGGAVASEIAVVKSDKILTTDEVRFPEKNSRENENDDELKESETTSEQRNKSVVLKEIAQEPLAKPGLAKAPELKSAATLRKKSKIIQPKKVQVIWEEHENAPNGWFILVAVFLTVFAGVLLFLAMRMK